MSRLPLKKDDRGSPISEQPQRYPSDSFDGEDLGYYLDKEDLIKSSRIYYEWEEHFFRTENGNIEKGLLEKKAQATDILSTDSIRISNSSEVSDANRIHQAFEPVKESTEILNDSEQNIEKAFIDFKQQTLFDFVSDQEKRADSQFQESDLNENDVNVDKDEETDKGEETDNPEEDFDDDPSRILGAVEEFIENEELFFDNESESPNDWEQFADALSDFEPQAQQFPDIDIQTEGQLTREVRAMQVAIDVGKEFGWGKDGIQLLAEIFNRYGWSNTRRSIEAALENDVSPEELRLAFEVREMWEEDPAFPSAFIGRNSSSRPLRNRSLSWPTTFGLIRNFSGIPDLLEIELYLNHLFDVWSKRKSTFLRFPLFSSYLYHCIINAVEKVVTGFEWPSFEQGEYPLEDGDPADNFEYIFREIL